MGKILTTAQKTFTDLYDSYVLNLSSDIVAVSCDQYGKAIDNYETKISYNTNVGTMKVNATCTAIEGTVPSGVTYGVDSAKQEITITVAKGTELEDDSEMGFKFTTTNNNAFIFERYITFVKIKSGEKIVTFQIKSDKGNVFKEGISEITLTTIAFDGLTKIESDNTNSENNPTYKWSYYDIDISNFVELKDAAGNVVTDDKLVVRKVDPHSNVVFRCVMTYKGKPYEDLFPLSHFSHNYDAVAKFFDGDNVIDQAEPFVVAYLELYKDQEKIETELLQATSYFYHSDNRREENGTMNIQFNEVPDTSKTDGNTMYVIYQDNSSVASNVYYTLTTACWPSSSYGTVSGSGQYLSSAVATLSATPASGCHFEGWSIEGESELKTDNPLTISVDQNLKVTAMFYSDNDNQISSSAIYVEDVKSVDIAGTSFKTYYSFTPTERAVYTLYSEGNVNARAILYDDNKSLLCWHDNIDAENGNYNFRLSRTLSANTTYYWCIEGSTDSAIGEITVKLIKEDGTTNCRHSSETVEIVEPTCTSMGYNKHICQDCGYSYTDSYIDATGIHSDPDNNGYCDVCGTSMAEPTIIEEQETTVQIPTANETYYFKFVPQHDGLYTFQSLNQENLDPDGYICDSQKVVKAYSTEENKGFNFSYMWFVAGQTYYLGIELCKGSGSVRVKIYHKHQLITSVEPEGKGQVIGEGLEDGLGLYNGGEQIELDVTNLSNGYEFDKWKIVKSSDAETIIESTIRPLKFPIDDCYAVLACLKDTTGGSTPTYYTLSLNSNSTSGGSVSGGGTYLSGTSVTITASVNSGYTFDGWYENGSLISTKTSHPVVVTSNRTITAMFSQNSGGSTTPTVHTLTVLAYPSNGGTVSGGGNYTNGSTATLTATANSGYKFAQWNDGATSATRTVTVTSSATYTATFELISSTQGEFSYTVNTDGTVKITGYTGSDSIITVPSTIDGKSVTQIGNQAFKGNSSLESVTISSGIKEILAYAFYEATSLKRVYLPVSVEGIYSFVFYGCYNLTTIYYAGTSSQWSSIDFGTDVYPTGVTINCNVSASYAAAPMMLAMDSGIETVSETSTHTLDRARYKAALYQYKSSSNVWTAVGNNSEYLYKNDLYSDVTSNIVVISKEDISVRRNIDFTVYSNVNNTYDNDLIVARANFTVFDLNDPIVSGTAPVGAKDGQLWLDTSKQPYVLYVYQNDKWELFKQQNGKTVYTSQPESYEEGDLWILGNGDECHKYNQQGVLVAEKYYKEGSMLRAIHSNTSFLASDWIDAFSELTKLQENITQTFDFGDDGLKIGRTDDKFYVKIDSEKMSFYDNSLGHDTEVVWIANDEANIDNLVVEQSATFECDATFEQQIKFGDNFVLQLETDGSLSLVLAQ